MALRPGKANAPYDIELSDGRKTYGLTLDQYQGSIAIGAATDDQLAVYLNNVGKRSGDFDEQRTWKGGRGGEFFSDDPTRFFDAENAWTLSNGHVTPTLQWRFARGLLGSTARPSYMPGNVSWKTLLGAQRYISIAIVPEGNLTARRVWVWVRRRGTPGTLTLELCANSGGNPSTVLKTQTVTTATITDIVSVSHLFEFSTSETLTGGTTYHIKIYGASTDGAVNHWDVGVDAATSGGKISSDNSSWSASGYTPYYHVDSSEQVGRRRWWGFEYLDATYIVDQKFDGTTPSVVFVNGDRGLSSSGSATTIVDAGKSWVADRWAGARVLNRGTGESQSIISNTTNTLNTSTWTISPGTTDYVIYDTEFWTFVDDSTTLAVVTAQPLASNKVAYFPQAQVTALVRMRYDPTTGNHDFAADGTNKADYMIRGYKSDNTAVIWRATNNDKKVSRAPVVNWGTDLTFATAVAVGSNQHNITGLALDGANNLRIFKEDSVWYMNSSEVVVPINYGIHSTPSPTNGKAAVAHQKFLYFNWLWSLEREYGLPGSTTNTLDDIGWGWKDPAIPSRDGPITSLVPVVAWLFATVDAGSSGTSSVVCWDGGGWHEIMRGFTSGYRAYTCFYQPCQDSRGRLWVNYGDQLVCIKLPLNKARPLDDSSINYQHEGVLYSGTIDMGTAAKLPKFIRQLTANTKNLSGGVRVEVDYQVDDNIGKTGYDNWITAGSFKTSPEDEVDIDASNIRQFRYRLRMMTDDADVPPDVKGVVPSGFARSQFRRVFTLRIKTGQIFTRGGTRAIPSDVLVAWLYDAARFPGRVVMTSKYQFLHNVFVVIAPITLYPLTPKSAVRPEQATMSISLMEVS